MMQGKKVRSEGTGNGEEKEKRGWGKRSGTRAISRVTPPSKQRPG